MRHSSLKKQKGVSLSGLLVWSLILFMVAILGMRLVPAYIENTTIKKALTAISNDPDLQSAGAREIRQSFDKRRVIDNIVVVRGSDIQIKKEKGKTILHVEYSVEKPLFANISLLIDFDATSKK